MPRQSEPNANNVLGDLLRRKMPAGGPAGYLVLAENTQTLTGHAARHPDVLITAPGRAPVVIEAEYEPAPAVEPDARERLGLTVADAARPIEAAIALRYPEAVGDAYDLHQAIAAARLSWCVWHQDGSRFPPAGWLSGSLDDLTDLIRLVSVPQQEVEQAADALEQGIDQAAARLDAMAKLRPAINPVIARLLGMADVPQTRRMACAIIANALVFHERIAGMHAEVKSLRQLGGPADPGWQDAILKAWERILEINYYPIFAIAKDLLMQLPSSTAAEVLDVLRPVAQSVDAAGVDHAHDLTGRIFQRLIADRKYLATFYTRPASAALLARLAVSKIDGVDWSSEAAIGRLRIGDFACGTGALLAAVYEQIAARHERAGGDPAKLHPLLLEEVLYGCDVMPSAVHITGATLAGAQPNVRFDQSRLYTMPYGRQADGSVKIGSLELLQSAAALTLFNTSDPARRTGSAGEETAAQISVDIPDQGFDLVIMNPPFTRNVTHEGQYADTYAAAFAAYESSKADQKDMSGRLDRFKRDTCYHGSAGMASAFAALADKKLKPGGVLALVLPLSVSAGTSWEKFRQMLGAGYTDLEVLSIANSDDDLSFSSDTGMAECLVVARKRGKRNSDRRSRFVSFNLKPDSFVMSEALSRGIMEYADVRKLEDGSYGGTDLFIGDDMVGQMLSTPYSENGEAWGPVRVSDYALAQTAYALSRSVLQIPGDKKSPNLPISYLYEIGKLGLYHLSLIGNPPQGCFTKVAPSPTATYPALWSHDAKKETKMVCVPDSQLRARLGMESRADSAWDTASRVHINQDFRFNSQPLAAAFTERDCIGGTAWPNVKFNDSRFDYVFVVWCNSTLGLLSFWWHSNRQQPGRGRITISATGALPILDLRALSDEQLAVARGIFEEFRGLELLPAYLADADPNRALLDRRVICDLLGLDRGVYQGVRRLAAKWCAEPSVHGGKKRPRSAGLVV